MPTSLELPFACVCYRRHVHAARANDEWSEYLSSRLFINTCEFSYGNGNSLKLPQNAPFFRWKLNSVKVLYSQKPKRVKKCFKRSFLALKWCSNLGKNAVRHILLTVTATLAAGFSYAYSPIIARLPMPWFTKLGNVLKLEKGNLELCAILQENRCQGKHRTALSHVASLWRSWKTHLFLRSFLVGWLNGTYRVQIEARIWCL